MKTANDTLILTAQTISGTYLSEPIHVLRAVNFSVQITYSSSSATVSLQCSNDEGRANSYDPTLTGVTNWTDITGSSQTVSSSGSGVYDVENTGYAWVRLVITGSMQLDAARITIKGA